MTTKFQSKQIVYIALFLALGVTLPLGFHAMGIAGRIFLPMHIPILLAGFLIGPACGLIVGILAPALSFFLSGMPPAVMVPMMTMELAIYGYTAGILYKRLQLNIYIALVLAMLLGRLMFALGLFILGFFIDLPYTASAFLSGGAALVSGFPGIILQIILIPLIVAAVKRSGVIKL